MKWKLWLIVAVLSLASCKPQEGEKPIAPQPTPEPSPTPPPRPTPEPTPFVQRKPMDTGMMFNGLQYKWRVETELGQTAARDREIDNAYRLELNLNIRVPRPATTMNDLNVVNARLPESLPTLPTLLESATVSPAFERLYELKLDWLKARLQRLEGILSRHNFYDCDTILQLQHPETGRKAIFIQSEMDVNVDGSDGDRNVAVDGSGQFFQPQTSYRWPKKTDRPNQFLEPIKEKLKLAGEELKAPDLPAAKQKDLRERMDHLGVQIRDLERWSFLVSETDPFIVLPGFMMRGEGAYVPKLGDYAVVIHEGTGYPAIVGDAGPSYKMGEASLRLCNQIKDTGTPLARPVSDLHVTYVVFPGTADSQRDVPDLEKWHARCVELLRDLGVAEPKLHQWDNLVPPWPSPEGSPSPTDESISEQSVDAAQNPDSSPSEPNPASGPDTN
jgi:hypothetical protein